MKAHKNLKNWREADMGLSTRDLAELLLEKMKVDFPDGFGRGQEIFQSDIVHAEKGMSRKRFDKVATAIYKYLDVPEGFFGNFVKVKPEEIISDFNEKNLEFRGQMMELQTRLIDAYETINSLNNEKIQMLNEIRDLRDELKKLKSRDK